jgi:hypothetical protein
MRTNAERLFYKLCLGLLLVLVLVGIVFSYQPVWLFHRRDFKVANSVISRVESFRKIHGHPPETLAEVGIDDPDLGVFYQKTGTDEYEVWFGTSLGESEIYDSHTNKWR